MSYTKTTWTTGDTITANKMNNIEDGIETACEYTMTTIIDNNGTLNKTVNEIAQLLSGKVIPILFFDSGYPISGADIGINMIVGIYCDEGEFIVYTLHNSYYEANTINDYPARSQNVINDAR